VLPRFKSFVTDACIDEVCVSGEYLHIKALCKRFGFPPLDEEIFLRVSAEDIEPPLSALARSSSKRELGTLLFRLLFPPRRWLEAFFPEVDIPAPENTRFAIASNDMPPSFLADLVEAMSL
jgi:hypothetical protein